MLKNKNVIHFDGMTWPRAGKNVEELDHKLRYSPDKVTKIDMLYAASILDAYKAMVWKTDKERRKVIRNLRDIERLEQPRSDEGEE